MKIYLFNLWDRMRTGFWFTPGLITFAGILLSFFIPWLDAIQGDKITEFIGIPTVSPSAAHQLLGAIASAMITVTGVVFSITVVTLSIASSQFGPRLLRTFVSSRATQLSLGVFLATSVYSLLVMAQVRDGGESEFVPQISLLFALGLLVTGVVFLIYYIHSVAALIQAPNVVHEVAKELDLSVDRLFPDEQKEGEQAAADDRTFDEILTSLNLSEPDLRVKAEFEGYLQVVDIENLIGIANRYDGFLAVPVRPGQFVIKGSDVVLGWCEEDWPDEAKSRLGRHFIVGNRPTPRQDIECCINELVEVAVRALSPGINDPMTALSCIERISAAIGRLAEKEPRRRLWEKEGEPRLLVSEPTFSNILETGFTLIRQYGRDSAPVMIRLLEKLTELTKKVRNKESLEAIEKQVSMIMNSCEKFFPENEDIQDARDWYRQARDSIKQENSSN
ncbi:MAG: DUF2254 domain-containing protein [Candidatus Omnitrophica bacterium]|nr:DUF2254 domain-containing protein [Candidatus Omnitrophota bacterium]